MLEKRRAAAKKAQETRKRIAEERAERKRMIEERRARETLAHVNRRPAQNNTMGGPKNSLKKVTPSLLILAILAISSRDTPLLYSFSNSSFSWGLRSLLQF
jgi:hypothetical protein